MPYNALPESILSFDASARKHAEPKQLSDRLGPDVSVYRNMRLVPLAKNYRIQTFVASDERLFEEAACPTAKLANFAKKARAVGHLGVSSRPRAAVRWVGQNRGERRARAARSAPFIGSICSGNHGSELLCSPGINAWAT